MTDFNVCRCCLSSSCYKDMREEYYISGRKEVYSDMLKNTFNITAPLDVNMKCLICDQCITKLQNASEFKNEVLRAERALLLRLSTTSQEFDDVKLKSEKEDLSNGFDDASNGGLEDDFEWEVNFNGDLNKEKDFLIKSEPTDDRIVTGSTKKSTSVSKLCDKLDHKRDVKSIKKAKAKTKSTATKVRSKIKEDSSALKKKRLTSSTQTQREKDLKENSLRLINNSNMCLFVSLKTKFRCYSCNESFLNMTELRDHSNSHSDLRLRGLSYKNVDITALECRICNEPCEDLDTLKFHLTSKHDIAFSNSDHLLIPYKLESDNYKCTVCLTAFNTFVRLSMHMNKHSTNNVCEICGESFINRNNLRTHLDSMHREKKCSMCPATFVTSHSRLKHMRKVHNRCITYKRYCLLCNKIFPYTYMLVNHKIEEHGAEKTTVNCPECGKTFNNKQSLQIHTRSVHIRERNYPCTECGRSFFTRCDLKRHESTHREVRAFLCAQCEGRFKSRDSWRRHVRKQHAAAASEQ